MQKKKARKGFLFLRLCAENLCCRLVGRGPCAPPGQMRCSAAGHMGPALQGAVVIRGGQSRPPLRTLSLRASPRREASALGVQTGAAIRFPTKERTDSHASDTVTGVGMTALPRCKAPSVRGLSAQPTGGEKKRVTDLPPPALRAATSLAEGGFGRPPP